MIKHVLGFLFTCAVFACAQDAVVTFSANNKVTWQAVQLDSIRVDNLTTQTSQTLIGKTAFDLQTESQVEQSQINIPQTFQVSANYPNAFQDKTRFHVMLPEKQAVSLSVYNILGQQVASLQRTLTAGMHQFALHGAALGSGVYFIKTIAGPSVKIIKTLKVGSRQPGYTHLSFVGSGQLSTQLSKNAAPGDHYRFIGYKQDFYPDTLDVTPSGGEHFQFSFLPVPPQDDFTSKWKGFNLLGKFTVEWSNSGYVEKDFIMISDFGFNFVRLPIDYRTYVADDDWLNFDESGLADIDDAVEWGQQYDIHVCINLHRGPGYCVNPPSTPLPADQDYSLWDDVEAQEAFAAHWAMLAERYADVSTKALSFNLVNEPANVDGEKYVNAMLPAIQAIRAVSPNRIIISDAVDWGNARVDEILDYGVIMSPHFYNPSRITHYKASWVNGSDSWPEPVWPIFPMSNSFYGSWKSYLQTPLIIKGDFPAGTELRIVVNQVSTAADFWIEADNQTIWTKYFKPGPGEGEWEKVIYREEWDCYQNIYNREYNVVLEKDAVELQMFVKEGDWMTFNQLDILYPDESGFVDLEIQPGITDWGTPQASYAVGADGTLSLLQAPSGFEEKFVMNGFLQQWIDLKKSGIPVHVGEWGVFNKTPHDVTIAFMRNRIQAMDSAGLGWALWNFRGSFGIMDSGREDVEYESYNGHQLDREMLNVLLGN